MVRANKSKSQQTIGMMVRDGFETVAVLRIVEAWFSTSQRLFAIAPEKRPCTPKDSILTPGFGYSITPVPKFRMGQGWKTAFPSRGTHYWPLGVPLAVSAVSSIVPV